MSPYHAGIIDPQRLHTDLYVCVDEENDYKYHARKLIAKLREVYHKENSHVFYKEFSRKALTEDEKVSSQYSFIINSLLFN